MSKVDLKVVMLGQEFVGKTSICERFINQHFKENGGYQTTIGAVFVAKPVVSSRGKKIVLGLWDTAGSERYLAMSRIFYRGASAAIVCYDIGSQASWKKAKFWVCELRKHEEDCRIYLCGTKLDLVEERRTERQVNIDDVEPYAEGIQAKSFETSSKTGKNVDRLFQVITDDFLSKPPVVPVGPENLRLHENVPKKKCC
ncbi:ras-related protein Rab-24-like [Ischnura elegans]|uniref:ras-related protein Rab-24-like n=1 Tax=Ischnura elegans TaxID=197161 RepID=UPI001ED8748B|nr:ras-related protein Rab-24-like [Ischnura elegans]